MNAFFSGLFGHTTIAVALGALLLSTDGPVFAPIQPPVEAEEILVARAEAEPADLAEIIAPAEPRDPILFPQITSEAEPETPKAEAPEAEPAEAPLVAALPAPLPLGETGPTAKRVVVPQPADGAARAAVPNPAPEAAPAPEPQTERLASEAGDPRYGIVTGSSVNLRRGPSTGFERVGRVRQGDIVQMIRRGEGSWIAIRDPSTGDEVWMHGDYLDPMS